METLVAECVVDGWVVERVVWTVAEVSPGEALKSRQRGRQLQVMACCERELV